MKSFLNLSLEPLTELLLNESYSFVVLFGIMLTLFISLLILFRGR